MTREELEAIAAAERVRQQGYRCRVKVCEGAGCLARGVTALKAAFQAVARGRSDVEVTGAGCMGPCSDGPLVRIEPDGTLYRCRSPRDVHDVVASHLIAGRPVARLALDPAGPFFAAQQPVVLAACGRIDPERIEEAIAAGAYRALLRAVGEMSPAAVIEQVRASGLRGRGGAGYPTGLKWATVAKAPGDRKYVICNADEGDPGAFMDRTVLEGDPHRVLEGMAIGAYAVGATQGYIYVRGEYPLAIHRLQIAIRQAEALRLLGARIADSGFSFRIDLRIGAGAYVCGEETALIASIEGRRGQPRPRPPYPAESGLWGAPTLINNVETFAAVPAIIERGGAWYAAIGTERSRGTKVFSLAGEVQRTGVIEVPMGIALRRIVEEIGGGAPPGRTIKAVQTGGPGGGCVPAALLDVPVDYESLPALGSMMGSGGMIVLDDRACVVDVTRYFMRFCMDESCGKCIPCRAGTVQLHDLLTRIAEGQGTADDLARLEELADLVRHASLCGLGQNAPNPLLSTLRHFRDEYLAHVVERRCPAGVCPMRPAAEVST
ncbi:MAG: NuoF family protein [Armatimonadota bacterium]|nr:NuoF family protein [Armatimonadota bacterium]MDR7486485.1 NuoF family protein [Armatimonadota bacterium]MDR7532252.1 NuoF family protein [Armatimonadota bacterium]MDR7537174.1 NuoF family protein [Armatimonadota bacterium]